MACQCQSPLHTGISVCTLKCMRHAGSDERCQDHYLSQHCHTPPRLPGVYWESVILGFQPSAAGTHTAHPNRCSPPRAPSTGHLGHTCNHICQHHHCHDVPPIMIGPPESQRRASPESMESQGSQQDLTDKGDSCSLEMHLILEAYWHCLTMIPKIRRILCGAWQPACDEEDLINYGHGTNCVEIPH